MSCKRQFSGLSTYSLTLFYTLASSNKQLKCNCVTKGNVFSDLTVNLVGRSISTALSAGTALAVTSGIIDGLGATTRTDNGREYYPYTTKKRVAAE